MLGRQLSVNEYAAGVLTRAMTYGHDPITGGLTREQTPEGTVRRTYDPATGRLTATWSGDELAPGQAGPQQVRSWTEYEYDDLGRLWKTTARHLGGQAVNLVTENTYDAAGTLDTVRHHNGPGAADDVLWDYDYDALGRLDVLKASRGGAWDASGAWSGAARPLLWQDYAHESDGQRDWLPETRSDGSSTTPSALPFSAACIEGACVAAGSDSSSHSRLSLRRSSRGLRPPAGAGRRGSRGGGRCA